MLTKDDLHDIGQLLKAEREETRKIVREETRAIIREELDANNRAVGTIVGTEIAAAVKKLDTKLEKLDERVSQLEQDHEFPHSH